MDGDWRPPFHALGAHPRRPKEPTAAPYKKPNRKGSVAAATTQPLGVSAGLEPYASVLDRRRAAHLLRRTGFGAAPAAIDEAVGRDALTVVDALLGEALVAFPPDPPPWADASIPVEAGPEQTAYIEDNQTWLGELRYGWIETMFDHPFRERLALFWSNHFVTGIDGYLFAVFGHRYLSLLRSHALGNLKAFVHAVGRDPAMLLYLDGIYNAVGNPNENYARELLELFTLGPIGPGGEANYSEDDVQELARALTGWVVDPETLSSYHIPLRHDAGEKTIFGRTAAYGYDEVIDLIFEVRGYALAHHVCRKLYRAFVYDGADEAVVAAMADRLIEEDWEMTSVVRALFSSAHFFDEAVLAARIKSPIELSVGFMRDVGQPPSAQGVTWIDALSGFLNQQLLIPPNVAGWPGHRTWIDTMTMPVRWAVPDVLVFEDSGLDVEEYRAVAEAVWPFDDPESAFWLPAALADHFMAVPLDTLDLHETGNGFAGDLERFPIPDSVLEAPPHVAALSRIFLGGIPWYEWSIHADGAAFVIAGFVRHLYRLPDYQLV